MEKRLFFRAATAGLGKYRTGGYGRIGVYRVNEISHFRKYNEISQIVNSRLNYYTILKGNIKQLIPIDSPTSQLCIMVQDM